MLRTFLNAKIHRARVTETDLHYRGSLTLDPNLLEAAGIAPDEQVEVYNITRGHRFTTYAIEGQRGKGEVCVNGAAAHLAEVDDLVIVATYCLLEPGEVAQHHARVILVDSDNQPAPEGP